MRVRDIIQIKYDWIQLAGFHGGICYVIPNRGGGDNV